MFRKCLVVAVILLFIGVAFASSINAGKCFYNHGAGDACLDDSDLVCWGELTWTDVQPGETVNGKFYLRNAGITGDLHWEISEWPEWGTWDFGSYFPKIPPGGYWIAFVNVTAPDQENETFTGYVKVINKNNASDFCIIDVSLATPVSQFQSNQQIPRFMQSIIERYPVMRQVLGL